MALTASRIDERLGPEQDRYYVLGNVLAGLALLEE